MFQRRRKRNDLLLAAFGFDKTDCHISKIHIGDFDIQKRAGAVSRGNQIIDGCPRPPLHPTVSLRAFEQAAQLFAGGTLSEDEELAFVMDVHKLFLDSKERAKKYTPKKYLSEETNDQE